MGVSNKQEKSDFGQVVEEYLRRGFGSFNKNDFEVYIFNWLLGNDCENKTDFEISRFLKIPESKIKRMRYEASLKYSNLKEADYRFLLLQALKNAKYRDGTSDYKILMSISDKNVRQYLSDLLEKDGRFFDSSFNSNIVTMPVVDLVFVLEKVVLSQEEHNDIMDEIKRQIGKSKEGFPKSISDHIKGIGDGVLRDLAGKIIGPNVADSLADVLFEVIKKKD